MSRTLDFNEVQSSFFDITLRDPDRTVVHLDIPTEETINALENMQGELERMKTGDKAAVAAIYDLAARLINCNFDYFTVTGEELQKKYGMNMVLTLKFFSTYMSYIEELTEQKN